MDDRKLQLFLAAVRTGSFNKAALEFNYTQSAVTQMMNSLEKEIGCKLLIRNHNGVKLTSEGEKLLPAIEKAAESLLQLKNEAQKIMIQETTTIRLGSFSSIANIWLPEVIKIYQEQHQNVVFNIHIGTNVLAEWLSADKIDLAFGDEERCKDFQWYPLMDDPYYAVMPSNLIPENIVSIRQEDFIKYPFIMAPQNALEVYLNVLPKKNVNIDCDDDLTLISMVAQGVGVTAMPKLCLYHLPDNVRVLELIPQPKRVIGIAVSDSSGKEVHKFVDFLRMYFDGNTGMAEFAPN